jgi:hypothetical protein
MKETFIIEFILLALCLSLLIAFCYTRDQLIGTTLVTVVGGLLGISTKRALTTTNVANVEQANIESGGGKP